jgi:cysteine-rich repeat protein
MTIRHRSIQLAALASLVGFVLAFSPALAFGLISKDDQKCINELNKNLGKVMKTQGKELDKCIKFGASGKLGAQSIEECTTADNGGKVGDAKAKTVSKVSQKCVAPPPFGGTDATTVNDAAVAKEILLIHDIFGTDLDESAIPKSVNKDAHKCQVDVSKAAHKCQDTKLKVYNKCKKDGLKGKIPPGLITSPQDLEDLCLGIGANGIPDLDNKIKDACESKLQDKISSKCAGVPQGTAFPGACVVAPDLRACLDELVECRVCLALNEADALARDCDLFDDGVDNDSCPPASPACGDGVLQEPLGEECDDNNNISGDGCTADCQDESCGDGIINDAPNEQCDDGNTQDGDCCSSSCQLESAATECRASAGACDPAETCTGASPDCPADQLLPPTTECRASAGICDVAESCTGSGAACPTDGFVSATTECRASAGVCDVAESCTGSAAACPADGFVSATTECRASAGVCDVAESCTGSGVNCPGEGLASATTECRASAGDCDVAESCTGSGVDCPADGLASATTECRASAGICDVAESCTGSGVDCPADGFESATTECRASAGICDVAESCTGSGGACPANGFVSATTECRASAGVCDVAESCTGGAAACPADGFESATTECRASAGDCDVAESCTGSGVACPADGLASATTECRASAGVCDIAESCTGSGVDCPADGKSTAECRADSGQCDVAEDCDGVSNDCPPDGFEPNGTGCDDADVCTPVDQCQDGFCLGSGTLCGDGTVQGICGEECDLPDDGACSAVEACNDDCLCQSFIGDHKCVLDPTPVTGSTVTIVTKILALPPFSASGALDILCGFEDPNTGKAPCECTLQSLDPINITGIGFICFTPGDPNDPCPTGEIDCDGGNLLDVTMDSDHDIGACTTNADCVTQCTAHCAGLGSTLFNSACEGFCQGGVNEGLPCTDDSECPGGSCAGKPVHGALCQCDCADVGGVPSGAGGLQCNLGANIDVEISPPCGDGDILIAVGARCIPLTTELVTSQMHNLNAVPGIDFPVPAFTAIGNGIACSTLATSTTTGITVVGSVNFFDSTIGDLQARIDFLCQ